MGPDDAARGREGGLGMDRAEGASWMRRRRRVADEAFIVYRGVLEVYAWSFVSSRQAALLRF